MIPTRQAITASEARDLFSYCGETGNLHWRVHPTIPRLSGRPASHRATRGYWEVTLKPKVYLAHRLIWLIVHGVHPPEMIDHINGDGLDNRISNLRLASRSQNRANSTKTRSNTGVRGVRLTRYGTYEVQIRVNWERRYLGTYRSLETAADVYKRAALDAFGEFAASNRDAQESRAA